jgi:hypothetical protein
MRISDVVGWIVCIGLIIGVLFGVVSCMEWVQTKRVCVTKTVKSIGGCSQRGWCGVSFTDETYGDAPLPVVGQPVSVRH